MCWQKYIYFTLKTSIWRQDMTLLFYSHECRLRSVQIGGNEIFEHHGCQNVEATCDSLKGLQYLQVSSLAGTGWWWFLLGKSFSCHWHDKRLPTSPEQRCMLSEATVSPYHKVMRQVVVSWQACYGIATSVEEKTRDVPIAIAFYHWKQLLGTWDTGLVSK